MTRRVDQFGRTLSRHQECHMINWCLVRLITPSLDQLRAGGQIISPENFTGYALTGGVLSISDDRSSLKTSQRDFRLSTEMELPDDIIWQIVDRFCASHGYAPTQMDWMRADSSIYRTLLRDEISLILDL